MSVVGLFFVNLTLALNMASAEATSVIMVIA